MHISIRHHPEKQIGGVEDSLWARGGSQDGCGALERGAQCILLEFQGVKLK